MPDADPAATALPRSPLEPATALDRIAYLLERAQAPTYRVRAFRNAAAAVRAAGAERVAALAGSGRLTDLTGIGPTTAEVVTQALRGEVPEYLAGLEAEAGDAPADEAAVAELLATLQGDLHAHSDWSDGGSPIDEMAAAAAALGHRYLAMTDHSPRLTVAHGLDADRLRRQLDVIDALNAAGGPLRILTGIEVDILDDGTLDQDRALLARLDVVVASVHSKLRMDAAGMTRRMVRAVSDPDVDVLGHCTGRIVVGRGRPPSTFDAAEVFAACAAAGTAVEINSRPERLDPPDELLAVAVAAGCHFSIDTDAHAPGQLEWQANGARKAVAAGIGADRVVNAMALPELVAWLANAQ